MLVGARLGAWSGKKLPYDAEVRFIKSTKPSEQYIDLGFRLNNNHRIIAKFEYFSGTNNTCLIGARSGANSKNISFACGNVNIASDFNNSIYSTYRALTTVQTGVIYEIETGKSLRKVNGIQNSVANREVFTTDNNCCIFYGQGFGGNSDVVSACFMAKIYLNEYLVFDLIPVRFTNELGISEGAMYDRVSCKLFRNAGTGAFVIGPDKVGTEVAGGGYKCIRRSWRSSRRSRHFSCWEVAA